MMKTPTRAEGSATFSLGELMKLEDERLAEVARECAAREKASAEARREAEHRDRAEAEAKTRAIEDDEAHRRRIELDETARREAMQRAMVEQARLEVEARTRADERERERRHEMELHAARSVESKPASLGSLIGATGFGGGLMFLVGCIVHFAVTQPTADRRLTEIELRAATAEQRVIETDHKLDDQRKQLAVLEKSRSALEAEVDSLRAAPTLTATPKGPKGPSVGPRVDPKRPEPSSPCDPHDPMCFTIRSGGK